MTIDYPTPFRVADYKSGEPPLTKLEMRLRALGSEIRAKPRWWLKVHDEALVAKWRAVPATREHAQAGGVHRDEMSDADVRKLFRTVDRDGTRNGERCSRCRCRTPPQRLSATCVWQDPARWSPRSSRTG